MLSQQLVGSYENGQPDIVSVVLDSNGFSNLLERLSFARRIRIHNQQIVATVILARNRVAAQAVRLAGLEGRQQNRTARVLTQRDQLDAAKLTLLNQQMSVTHARDNTSVSSPALAATLVQVLQDWYTSEPLLLFQFDSPPPGALPDYWYVAEQIDAVTTAVGTKFQAGQRVASFAARGTGIEIGWGSATSNTRTLAGATDPAAASPPAGSTTSWGESFKSAFGIH